MIADTTIREGEATPTDIVLYVPPDWALFSPPLQQETTIFLWANQYEAMAGADVTDIVVMNNTGWNPALTSGTKKIVGITKDSTGVILGGCVVDLYETAFDVKIASTISDPATGAYEFSGLTSGLNFYVVAYKAGSPDVAGTTVNSLAAT